MKNTEAAREMRERYLVSPQKTALAITIANREREILKDIDYENGYSLYIGIPVLPKYLSVLFLQLLSAESVGEENR